ncbi:hypothetical protein [Halolamina sp.]|jgi:hypothetical protein|nr:hypothetical protein Halar_1991 [halophilic archaeon DL31]
MGSVDTEPLVGLVGPVAIVTLPAAALAGVLVGGARSVPWRRDA